MSQVFVRARVSEERLQELKRWALDNRTTVQEMILAGLDLLLNPGAESTEKTVKEFTPNRHELVHNYPIGTWQRWSDMVLASDNEDAITGLAANIRHFLSGIAADIDMDKEAHDPAQVPGTRNIPDYAVEVRSARLALQQLRTYFETKRKTLRRTYTKTST